jgi:hypothetical protein
MTMMSTRRTQPVSRWIGWLMAALAATLVAACGGDGGGGDASDAVPVVLGQPGPGDPGNYFPLAVGNFWHFRGYAEIDGARTPLEASVQVVGTRVVDGVTALVVRESDPQVGGDGTYADELLVKDLNGVAVLGVDDDPTSQAIVPYWEVRFPLEPGSAFVQIDAKGIDFGEDLDGDGRNETVDVRSVVSMVGFETVTVPVGTFAEAAHLRREVSLRILMSRDGAIVNGTEAGNAWFARGVGWIQRTSTVAAAGVSVTTREFLDAFLVDGVAGGIAEAPAPVINGSVGADGASFVLWRDVPAGRRTAVLAGLSAEADLRVLTASCTAGSGTQKGGLEPEDCTFDGTGGPLVVRVAGAPGTRYQLWQAPTPSIASPVNEASVVAASTVTVGQVGARGESTYAASGLASGRYTISIAGLSDDADLKVYADDTYSVELDCTLRSVGDVMAEPEDCTTSSDGGLYFRVRGGELNMVGASYLIMVHPAP